MRNLAGKVIKFILTRVKHKTKKKITLILHIKFSEGINCFFLITLDSLQWLPSREDDRIFFLSDHDIFIYFITKTTYGISNLNPVP